MTPSEWIKKIHSENYYREFPMEMFRKSCLIYKKNDYGIFLLEDMNGEKYTAKVLYYPAPLAGEVEISLYIKEVLELNKALDGEIIPTFLLPDYIYVGRTPLDYPLFNQMKDNNLSTACKSYDIRDIFFGGSGSIKDTYEKTKNRFKYVYYLTKACQYNLAQYFGVLKKTISYQTFVKFAFEFLVGMQTLYSLGIWHKDIKSPNILVCVSSVSYVYLFPNGERRFISSKGPEDNKVIKIIDFGEAKIYDTTDRNNTPCKLFMDEINFSVISILNLMWSKTVFSSKDDENKDIAQVKYNNLVSSLKACDTDLIPVLLNSDIFKDLFAEPDIKYVPVQIL